MKITHVRKKGKNEVFFVHVDRIEAYRIISSLAQQLERNDPNLGREEFFSDKSEYFSIAVEPELPPKKLCPLCQGEDSKSKTIWGNEVRCPACKGERYV